jgi:sugar phosphate isomerase/epimerase
MMAVAGVIVIPEFAISKTMNPYNVNRFKTALQLYSVRDAMSKEPLATLEALAKIGYKYVEHANYSNRKFYGMTPPEFKMVLDNLGMEMPSGHTVLQSTHWDKAKNDFTDEWKYLVEDAAFMGQKFVISPSLETGIRQNYDELLRFMDIFNQCGELCGQYGMQFGYHNHDFEFREKLNEQLLWDIMMEHTDPKMVVMQLDSGNMFVAGAQAKEVLTKYPGRYANLHLKDMQLRTTGEGFESTVIGTGLLPMQEIIELSIQSGTTLFVIEQEAYQGKDPLLCMEENFKMMNSWGHL